MTNSDTWRKAAELYREVLGREEGRRAAYLEDACSGDEELLQEVLSLLSGVERVEDLLLLLVEALLRHFLPGETQVALGGDHAQPDRSTGRQQE